jgi:hypothetical protein
MQEPALIQPGRALEGDSTRGAERSRVHREFENAGRSVGRCLLG